MENNQVKRIIGIFLSSVFTLVTIMNFKASNANETKDAFVPDYFFTYLLIGMSLLLILTTFKIMKVSGVIHVVILFSTGFIAVFDNTNYNAIHGEIIVMMGLLVARTYSYFEKRFNLFFFSLLGLSISLKLFSLISNDIFDSFEFIMYLILVCFINFFFFVVLTSVEEKQKNRARHICNHWQKEQVYIDIGKNVFSSFIHDYSIVDSFAGLEYVQSQVKKKKYENVEEMVQNVMDMLAEDDNRIRSVRSRVIMSQKTKPENVDIVAFLYSHLKKLRFSRSNAYKDIQLINNSKSQCEIMVVPIDLAGIVENILKNAVEATHDNRKDRKIVIELSEKGKSFEISILNNGPKIPWAKKNHSVNPNDFVPGNTTKKEGTGWGMYATIHRIEDNKGKIKITSNAKETVFKITFPLVQGVKVNG